MIRGHSTDSPVLLHLAGGPGGTDIGAMRADTTLESDFVVATWDQRGTGKSYATSIDPVEQLTVEQAVADTLEVVDHLRDRFGQDQIYLSANSWGTIPGVLTVQQAPQRFHAYIGTGQMVNNRLTDRMFYEDALAWAQDTGNVALAQQILQAGPPPYENLLNYGYTVSYEHQWNAYPGVEQLWEMPFNTFVPENNLLDRINALRGMLDVNYFVYPQLQDYDFRTDVPVLEVPVHMVVGEHEARGRAVLADDWFDQLQAPVKERIVFDRAGHRPSFERPTEFAALMRRIAAETTITRS
jgi:proline iminopeptidase